MKALGLLFFGLCVACGPAPKPIVKAPPEPILPQKEWWKQWQLEPVSDAPRAACEENKTVGCYVVSLGAPAKTHETMRKLCKSKSFAPACAAAAVQLTEGVGVSADPKQGFTLAKSACLAGSLEGCEQLAWHWQNGKGTPADKPRAQAQYKAVCRAGRPFSCLQFAARMEKQKKYRMAVAYYSRACNGGSLIGCRQLEGLVARGCGQYAEKCSSADGVEKRIEARCKAGEGEACAFVATVLWEGQKRDPDEAFAKAKKSCNSKSAWGCTVLAGIYQKGFLGLERDPNQAATLYKRACDAKFEFACNKLVRMHLAREMDKSEAFVAKGISENSCEAGNAIACSNYVYLCSTGEYDCR